MIPKPTGKPITDQERINFILKETHRSGVCSFEKNYGQKHGAYQLFTMSSAQCQYGNTIREVIDKSMLYESPALCKSPEWFNEAIVRMCEAGVEAYIKLKKERGLP